jgi:ABC-type branched-subunit amino acid transport system substrate-binding protein
VLAAVAVVAMLAAACGSDNKSSSSSTTGASAGSSSTTGGSTASSGATTTSKGGSTASSGGTVTAPANLKGGPGVDLNAKTISVAELSPLSGPVAVIGEPLTNGQRVYFKSVNDAGGIGGFKVTLVEKDEQYNPQLHKQAYNEVKDQIALVAQSLGTPTTAAILDDSKNDNVILFPASLGSALTRIPNVVIIGTPYRLETENVLDWVAKNKGAKEGSKYGIIYQNDEYGQDGLAGFELAATAQKFNVVAKLTYAATDKDFTSQVQQMKDSGAEFVHLTATPSQLGPILAKSAELGFNPIWTADGPGFSTTLLTAAKLPAALFKNVYISTSAAAWGEDVPGMKTLLDNVQKYDAKQTPDGFFVFGYSQATVVKALLEQAIKDGDLSREGIAKASTELKNIDTGGLLPNLSYGATPEERVPSRDSGVFVVDDTTPAKIKRVAANTTSDVAKNDKF